MAKLHCGRHATAPAPAPHQRPGRRGRGGCSVPMRMHRRPFGRCRWFVIGGREAFFWQRWGEARIAIVASGSAQRTWAPPSSSCRLLEQRSPRIWRTLFDLAKSREREAPTVAARWRTSNRLIATLRKASSVPICGNDRTSLRGYPMIATGTEQQDDGRRGSSRVTARPTTGLAACFYQTRVWSYRAGHCRYGVETTPFTSSKLGVAQS